MSAVNVNQPGPMLDQAGAPPIVDAFTSPITWQSRPLELLFWRASVGSLEPLRRAADKFRPRWASVPPQFTTIPARDTFYYQFKVKPGSWLWGVNFQYDYSTDTPYADWGLLIKETETGILMSVDSVSMISFQGQGFDGLIGMEAPNVRIVGSARPILSPGQIEVELSNLTATARLAQLVLFFAEPKLDVQC